MEKLQHKKEYLYNHLFCEKRLANLIGVSPGLSGLAVQKGCLKTYSAPQITPSTRLAPQDGATVTGTLACGSSTANQILVLTGNSSTPFFKATLYDSVKNTVTNLTISGALAESATDLKDCSLVWLPTRSAWYFKSGGAAKVYPLTLSGTTLTVGTVIDISGSFATATNTLMTADTTTGLFFFDNVAAVFKKFTTTGLSAGSFGSALTNPATGYSATAGDANEMSFNYSNGKIYFAAPSAAGVQVITFQEYDVTGNSWATKTWPAALRLYPAKQCILIADPSNNTNLWILGSSNTNSDTPIENPVVFTWTSATNTSDQYCYLLAYSLAQLSTSGLVPTTSINYPFVNKNLKAGWASVTNGDIVFVAMAGGSATANMGIWNIGTQWGRQTVVSYTGSGYLLGISAPISIDNASPVVPGNESVTMIVTIDGGTERWINLHGTDPKQTFTGFKLQFTTSLKIELVGGGNSSVPNAPTYRPEVNVLTNIIS